MSDTLHATVAEPVSGSGTSPKERIKPTDDDLRERMPMIDPSVGSPQTDAASPAPGQVVDAKPFTSGLSITPLGMMVNQQAFAFNLMLNTLQMQRQFFHIWRPTRR